MKQKLNTIIGVSLLFVLIFIITAAIYIFGLAGIFKLLGIEYHSIWSFILFVVIFFSLASIIELFTDALIKIITANFEKNFAIFLLKFSMQTIVNVFCLLIVDLFMDSIAFTMSSALLVALIVSLLEVALLNDDYKEKVEQKVS